MAFVSGVLAPIIQLLVYTGLGLWILYLIHWVIKKTIPDYKFIIKYKLFHRKMKDEKVIWCIEAIEKGWGEVDIKRFVLLQGKGKNNANDMIYIFKQTLKEMKGGNNGKQHKKNNFE